MLLKLKFFRTNHLKTILHDPAATIGEFTKVFRLSKWQTRCWWLWNVCVSYVPLSANDKKHTYKTSALPVTSVEITAKSSTTGWANSSNRAFVYVFTESSHCVPREISVAGTTVRMNGCCSLNPWIISTCETHIQEGLSTNFNIICCFRSLI